MMRATAMLSILLLAVATRVPPAAAAERVVHTATGSGHLAIDGESRTFSFTAREYADGRDDGHAQVHNRSTGAIYKIAVDCLAVFGSAAAVMGTVADSTDPSVLGQPALFGVVDRGEGAGAPADLMTLVFFSPPFPSCDAAGPPPDFLINEVERGNIQVQ